MSMISEQRARELAGLWHSGQWSGLYKVSSAKDHGALTCADWGDAYRETVRERALQRGAERAQLSALAGWIEIRARKYGYIVSYGDSPTGARLAPAW